MNTFQLSRSRRARLILRVGVLGSLAALLLWIGSGYGSGPGVADGRETIAAADRPGDGPPRAGRMESRGARRPGGGPAWMAARGLGLSDDQRESLQPVRKEYIDGMRDLGNSFESGSFSAGEAGERAVALRERCERKVQSILTTDQWNKASRFRETRRERMIEHRGGRLGQGADRQAGFYIRHLDLNKDQAASVRRILENTIPERRKVADQVEGGSLQPEQGMFLMRQIDKDTEREVRALLTPGQARRLDALNELRPKGPGRGPRHPEGRHSGGPHRFGRRGPRF